MAHSDTYTWPSHVHLLSASLRAVVQVSNNDVREVPPLMGNLPLNKLSLVGNPLRTMPSAGAPTSHHPALSFY